MNYTIIALMISIALGICAITVRQAKVEVFYVWPAEVDRGLCDTITVNTAAYFSRVKNQELSLHFLKQNIDVAQKYNYGFKVLNYRLISMSIESKESYVYVNVTILFNLTWGQYVSKCWLLVVVLNKTSFTDPLIGEEYINMTIACTSNLGRPASLYAKGNTYLTYSHDNVWILVAPSSIGSVILEDWRGIRVEIPITVTTRG